MSGLNYSISQNLLENNRSDMSSPMCQHFSLESSFVKLWRTFLRCWGVGGETCNRSLKVRQSSSTVKWTNTEAQSNGLHEKPSPPLICYNSELKEMCSLEKVNITRKVTHKAAKTSPCYNSPSVAHWILFWHFFLELLSLNNSSNLSYTEA